MTKDPVCGMIVPENDKSEKTILEKRVYYFCSSICKTLFDESPNQYIEKEDKEMAVIANSNQITTNLYQAGE